MSLSEDAREKGRGKPSDLTDSPRCGGGGCGGTDRGRQADEFPGAAVTNSPELGSSQQRKYILLFWRPEVQNQGAGGSRAVSRLRAPEEGPSLSLRASGGPGHLFLDLWPFPSNLCLYCPMAFPCLCVLCSSCKDTSHWIGGPPSTRDDFSLRSLANDTVKTPFPNKVRL